MLLLVTGGGATRTEQRFRQRFCRAICVTLTFFTSPNNRCTLGLPRTCLSKVGSTPGVIHET